jgi:carboxyl-terminal processing protease
VEGKALVTDVTKDSPAEKAGVKPGWIILKINEKELEPIIKRISELYENRTLKNLMVTLGLKSNLKGDLGDSHDITFVNEKNEKVTHQIELIKPNGKMFKLGKVPFGYVWSKSREIEGDIGYIAFNNFFDIPRIMPFVNDSMKKFMSKKGIIFDLRGNTGGVGMMAPGIAGWLVREKGKSLGTMITRSGSLKFAINPRPEAFTGKVAILVDGLSASTTEIFAAGLKDLNRARIFGVTTAGAALPSWFKTLPNEDVFQYAIANYKSAGGGVLEAIGVIPDQETPLTREALLKGEDPALDAAVKWIKGE